MLGLKLFVCAQAAKVAFNIDVGKLIRIPGDLYRIGTFAAMRLTHEHWGFCEDNKINHNGQTFAFEVDFNAEDTEEEICRAAVARSLGLATFRTLVMRPQLEVTTMERLSRSTK